MQYCNAVTLLLKVSFPNTACSNATNIGLHLKKCTLVNIASIQEEE